MRTVLLAVLAAVGAATPAAAHVQVRPAQAAPGDAVLWEVIVPGEREEGTVQVELAVPPGVLPFSYARTPGWSRELERGRDGSVRSIVWKGRMAPDGLTRFSFLASTPDREGTISWKALQTYAGGDVVRWIGSASSEFPAATTRISKDAAREDAGGENQGSAQPRESDEPAAQQAAGDDSDVLPLALGGTGLAVGLLGLGLAIGARRQARS